MRTSAGVGESPDPLLHVRRGRTVLSTNDSRQVAPQQGNSLRMLYTVAIVLIVLWLFGLVSSYTMGGFVHILLVLAVILVLVRLISGSRLAR